MTDQPHDPNELTVPFRKFMPQLAPLEPDLEVGQPCDCGRYPTVHRARAACVEADQLTRGKETP